MRNYVHNVLNYAHNILNYVRFMNNYYVQFLKHMGEQAHQHHKLPMCFVWLTRSQNVKSGQAR